MFFCKVFIFEYESHTEVGRQANKEKQLPKWSRVFVLLVNVENFGEYVFKLPCHLIPKAGLFLCVRSDTYGPACLVKRGCRCSCCAYVMWPSAKTCVPPLPKATPLAFVWSAGTDRFSCYQNSCSNHTSHALEREDDARIPGPPCCCFRPRSFISYLFLC